MTAPTIAVLALHAAFGVLLGLLYFRAVWSSARLLARGARPARALAFTALRLVLLAGALLLVAREGALPLLATALGLLAGRAIVLRRVARNVP